MLKVKRTVNKMALFVCDDQCHRACKLEISQISQLQAALPPYARSRWETFTTTLVTNGNDLWLEGERRVREKFSPSSVVPVLNIFLQTFNGVTGCDVPTVGPMPAFLEPFSHGWCLYSVCSC